MAANAIPHDKTAARLGAPRRGEHYKTISPRDKDESLRKDSKDVRNALRIPLVKGRARDTNPQPWEWSFQRRTVSARYEPNVRTTGARKRTTRPDADKQDAKVPGTARAT